MAEEPDIEPGATPVEDTQPKTPGAKLRAAREAQGLSLQDVAMRTRIAFERPRACTCTCT